MRIGLFFNHCERIANYLHSSSERTVSKRLSYRNNGEWQSAGQRSSDHHNHHAWFLSNRKHGGIA